MLDKKIVKQLVKNLRNELNDTIEAYRIIFKNIKNAKTVEDLMQWKTHLILVQLRDLFLDTPFCYFCIKYKQICSNCEYSKIHGICNKENSDFAKILIKWNELNEAIKRLYFKKGERYD